MKVFRVCELILEERSKPSVDWHDRVQTIGRLEEDFEVTWPTPPKHKATNEKYTWWAL